MVIDRPIFLRSEGPGKLHCLGGGRHSLLLQGIAPAFGVGGCPSHCPGVVIVADEADGIVEASGGLAEAEKES